jgi:murein endopeptidase
MAMIDLQKRERKPKFKIGLNLVSAVFGLIAAVSSVTILVLMINRAHQAGTAACRKTDGFAATVSTDFERRNIINHARLESTHALVDAGTSPIAELPFPDEVNDVPHLGQSVGYPSAGTLFDGRQFPPGDGYILRHPDRAWATQNTIEHVQRAFSQLKKRYPNARRLLIGDLSWRTGGRMSGHRSHQSGRDIDVFFYRKRGMRNTAPDNSLKNESTESLGSEPFEKSPTDYGMSNGNPGHGKRRLNYRKKMKKQIQLGALLEFIIAVCETHDEPSGVEWIMLDYIVQEWLVSYGEKKGVDAAMLTTLFQVPHGPAAHSGIVRHYPGHMDHLHIRFKCPPSDRYCHSPKKGPVSHFDR